MATKSRKLRLISHFENELKRVNRLGYAMIATPANLESQSNCDIRLNIQKLKLLV